jgi:hypothetical protein
MVMGPLANIPQTKTRLEVQVKKAGGTKKQYGHLENINIFI